MTELIGQLTAEARKRGLHGDSPLDPGAAFALVRDMPYRRASNREPATTIREWRGTCSGKHYLLQAVLAELGVESDLMACTAYVEADPDSVPAELGDILREGPVPDVHNYLRLPEIVDATWPLEAEAHGLPVNPQWTPGRDMRMPFNPIMETKVPRDVDAQTFKDQLLREHFSADELDRRERFFRALAG